MPSATLNLASAGAATSAIDVRGPSGYGFDLTVSGSWGTAEVEVQRQVAGGAWTLLSPTVEYTSDQSNAMLDVRGFQFIRLRVKTADGAAGTVTWSGMGFHEPVNAAIADAADTGARHHYMHDPCPEASGTLNLASMGASVIAQPDIWPSMLVDLIATGGWGTAVVTATYSRDGATYKAFPTPITFSGADVKGQQVDVRGMAYLKLAVTTADAGAGTVAAALRAFPHVTDAVAQLFSPAAAGTVTSVAVSGSDGIEVDSGSPITGAGTIALGIHAANLRAHLNVEDGADVTDAANVDAAGAVMNADASTAGMSFVIDEDNMASDSATKVPTQQSVKAYVDALVTGLLDFKGSTDASANPNYPAASKGDAYYVSVAGKIGGASGKSVEIGDLYIASADNAGGTEASVGTSWFVLEHNLVGAVIAGGPLGTPSSGTLTNCTGLPAAAVTYAPTTNADWDGAADPGDVDDALDQLAERTKDLEGASSPLNNHAASVPPTANDDSGDGYSVGSAWTDTVLDEAYQCADATPLAAVWNKVPKRQVRALTSDNSAVSSTSYVDVVGFTFPILASKDYAFDFTLNVAASGTGVGVDVAVNGPSSPTLLCYEQVYWTSATARTERCATAYDNNTASTGSNGTAEKVYRVRGVVRNGSNAGNLTARVKVEAASGGNCTVKAGSFGVVERLATWPVPATLLDSVWFVDLLTDTDAVQLDDHTPTGPNVPSAAWGAPFWIDNADGGPDAGDGQEIEIASNAVQIDGTPAGGLFYANSLTLAEADVEVLYAFEAAGGTIDTAVVGWLTDWVDANNYEMVGLHISSGTLYKMRYGATAGTGIVADATSLGSGSWPLYLGFWHVGTSLKMALFSAAPPAAPVLTATYTLDRTPGNHHGIALGNVASGWQKPTAIYVQPAGAAPTWELF